jgi:hypothetical protein
MRTYYDPEDDSFCEKSDRYERLLDLADQLRDEAKDRLLDQDGPSPEEIHADAMCDAMDAIDFNLPSGGSEKPPVAMLPADADTTLWGVGVSDAAGGYAFTDTADSIRPPTPEEDASYKAAGVEYAEIARALLATRFHLMTGREINACQIATGDFDTDEGFNAHLIDSLAIQYSKEIAEHINQNANILP